MNTKVILLSDGFSGNSTLQSWWQKLKKMGVFTKCKCAFASVVLFKMEESRCFLSRCVILGLGMMKLGFHTNLVDATKQ